MADLSGKFQFVAEPIWYLSANTEPVVSSSLGVSRVSVRGAAISSEGLSGAAHSPQNFVSAGFSKLHLGHFIFDFPCTYSAKQYQLKKKESN